MNLNINIMKLKEIWRLYPIVLVIVFYSVFYLIGKRKRDNFCINEINSKIIGSSDPQKKL
ncbi:hypothetical protein EAG11_15975 [Flavobacterium sp. 140616W15]|nr:hypothetical protein EAG11_15975 [Flavobacterium sp. 140616W15]